MGILIVDNLPLIHIVLQDSSPSDICILSLVDSKDFIEFYCEGKMIKVLCSNYRCIEIIFYYNLYIIYLFIQVTSALLKKYFKISMIRLFRYSYFE